MPVAQFILIPSRLGGSSSWALRAADGFVHHTVRPGECLARIAKHYRVGVRAIVRANALADPSRIYPGQTLVVPVPKPAPSTARVTTGSAERSRSTNRWGSVSTRRS